jgi:uncharacterized membrane protein
LHILSWGIPALSASLLLVIGASVLAYRAGRATPKAASWRENANSEVVYVVFFAATLLMRSLKPELFGLEKLMDWGFINALLISQSIPPADPWFAGATINYYYFGHAVAAGLITLSHVPSKFGYNLMFAHVFACAGIGIFELSRMLLLSFGKRGVFRTNIFAVAGALLVVFGGNFHFIIYGWIRPRLQLFGLVSPPALPYRFSNSARFIGYDPPTLDKTITEFPGYSVYIGDLHAHVLNLPIAISLLTLSASVILFQVTPSRILSESVSRELRGRRLACGTAFILLLAWSGMTNIWDLPIYLAMLGLAVAVSEFLQAGQPRRALAAGLAVGIAAAVLAIALAWPFWRQFHPFSRGFSLPRHASPLWQLSILYGIYYVIGAAAALTLRRVFDKIKPAAQRSVACVGLLFAFAFLLLCIPELISVKDIYGDDYQRANTMFKTSYQAYLMLGIASPVAIGMMFAVKPSSTTRLGLGMAGSALLAFSLSYGWFFYDQLLRPPPGKGLSLNGELFIAQMAPGDAQAIDYLRAHVPKPGEAIVEAAGESFTFAARISSATGIPTVLGWKAHEWLWRGLASGAGTRGDEVAQFYAGADEDLQRAFIRRYRVRYVIIGKLERERYPEMNEARLQELGSVVQDRGSGTTIIEVDPSAP